MMKTYNKYKDSSDIWLGEIPDHWDVSNLKHFVDIINGYAFKSEDYSDEEGIPIIRIGDISNSIDVSNAKRVIPKNLDELDRFIIKRGDLLLAMTGATIGKNAMYDSDDISYVNQRVSLLRGKGSLTQSFLKFYIDTPLFKEFISLACAGSAQENISSSQVGSLRFALPPIEEQTKIAQYLDHQTAIIDQLILQKEKLIELLKEKRQAVINEAVTKGLNPNAKMKDSGIEWLGEVPEHWVVMALKRVIDPDRPITYGIVQPGEGDPHGRYMIRGQDYSKGWANPESLFRVADEIEIPYARARVKPGDLLITIVGAGVGNLAIVPEWLDGANLTQTTARLAIEPSQADTEFMYYLIGSEIGRTNINLWVKGAAQPGLNIGHIKNYIFPFPPITEQLEIKNRLKLTDTMINNLVSKLYSVIDKLKEYRQSIISEAVTGNIDVRDWQPNKHEMA